MKDRLGISIVWIVILVLLVCTRLPLRAVYFSIDNVNLALAIEKFDPTTHQPQPPGYPLFVLQSRMVIYFLHTAGRTFFAISILASALSL